MRERGIGMKAGLVLSEVVVKSEFEIRFEEIVVSTVRRLGQCKVWRYPVAQSVSDLGGSAYCVIPTCDASACKSGLRCLCR